MADSSDSELHGYDSDDDCQGPHTYWRKRLKPVQSPIHEEKEFCPRPKGARNQGDGHEKDGSRLEREERPHRTSVVRRRSSGERMDDAKIREKFKAKAVLRKDSFGKTRGPMVAKANSSGLGTSPYQSPSVSPLIHKRRTQQYSSESEFTRNVVNVRQGSPGIHRRGSGRRERDPNNPTRIPVPAGEIKRHGSAPNTPALGRKVMAPNVVEVTPGSVLAKKRVEKVLKARLYLLQQTGPNSFLIGGDSPDHKYRVIIGPQRCSCGRGPHCLHVLFVMLRVFQVPENSSYLWNKTLKNFEVESLFRKFRARRTSRIEELMKKKNRLSNPEPDKINETDEKGENVESEANSDHESDGKEDEETCPICLLEMMEGESLVECQIGCQNKLHHHCISIWFEECKRQNEPLICPLCRANWKADRKCCSGDRAGAAGAAAGPLSAPPNSRASSPPTVPPELEGDMLLPHAEPIPQEHMETAQQWIPVLGEEIVSCLYSKNWVVREIALKQMSRTAVGSLLLGVGDGRSGVVLSPSRRDTTHSMLRCCCSVLAHICADPVYKVFVGALRALRTVLSYTPCRDEIQQRRLQALLSPVIDTILLKCADSNKRTSQLSISALQELVKGQDGELAVGREILHPGSIGLGGTTYLINCITQEYTSETAQWQWLLGRFYMLDKLIDDYPTDFIIRIQREEFRDTDRDDDVDCPEDPREHYINYDRVFAVLKFAVPVMNYGHSKVAKMARRVFFMVSRLQAHLQTVFKQINDLLDVQEMNVQVHMKRKLLRVAEEYHLAQQMGAHREDMDEPIPPFTTPIISASSTPRSSSPVNTGHTPHINVTVHNFVTGNLIIPSTPAPPNSPQPKFQQRRQEQAGEEARAGGSHTSPRSEHEADGASACGSTSSHDPTAPLTPPPTPHRPRTLPIPVNLRRTSSANSHDYSQDPSDSDECSAPHSVYEEDIEKLLENGEEQESFDSHDGMGIPEAVVNTTGPGVRTLERKRKVEVVDVSVSTSPRLSLRGLNVVTPSELEVLIQHHEQLETSPSVSHPMTVACSIHGMTTSGTQVFPTRSGVLESTHPVFEGEMGTRPREEVLETDIEPELTFHAGAPSAHTLTAPEEQSNNSNRSSHDSSRKVTTREVGTSPMPTQEVLAMPQVHKVAKVQHTRSASLPITLPLVFGEPLSSEVLKPNLPDQLAGGGVTNDRSPSTPCTPLSDVTSHRLSIIRSEDEGLRSDNDGLRSDEEGLQSDDDCLKSYDEGLKSDDEGLKSDDEGLRSDDELLSSANATINTTDNYEDFAALTLSPSRSEDSLNKVTFKTEVATTPNRSPTDTGGASSSNECHCKEEVELEEAQALIEALERSTLSQEALPYVPGLCQDKTDGETMTIHVQDGQNPSDGSQYQQYQENVHWIRGYMLGTGAFSTCYQARDVKSGTLTAVKQISFCRNSMSEQEKVIEEVEEEIQMMAKLNNPNIVRILGATKQGAHFFMFTEWMPGGSVSSLLDMYGAFTEQVISSYVIQILKGLAYLHDNHVLHRDLKGANLLVDSTGQRVRIGDFGAAARLASRTTGAGEFQGQLLGTIAFMAPEVLRGEAYGRSCDIWSLGCTIIEMATTKPPWGAADISNHLALIFRIASATVAPPIPDGLSPALRDILLRCLETNREERPPAKELLKHPLFTMYFRKR